MECLESLSPQTDNIPDVDVGIIGGAALVWVWNMDSIWSRNKEALYPMPPHFTSVSRISCSLGITTTAWVFWLQCCFCLSWYWQENGLDCLAQYASFDCIVCQTITWAMWSVLCWHGANRKICCSIVPASSALNQVNDARPNLFNQNRKMDNIPLIVHALDQHLKKAVYQAGHIWGQYVLSLTLNFHHNICGVGTRQLMTIRRLHAGLPFERQPEMAKNCWNVGVKMHVRRDTGVWKQTYYAQTYATVRKTMYHDLPCIMSFVAYTWCYV